MTLTAPCYSRSDYWRHFRIDYAGLAVLDLGSSQGSFAASPGFVGALKALAQARLHISLDVETRARPRVVGDAQRLPFPSECFDVVIANNVIEHLEDPQLGTAEILRVVRPSGLVLFTVPFLYPVHEAPHDFTRFTVYGLQRLFRDFSSIEVHSRGGWFSTVAQLVFLATRGADRWGLGVPLRAVLYPFLWVFVQLDRWDRSEAFTRVYYGTLRR